MKRIMLFMMLMLGTVSAVMAQGADVPATDYDAMIGTFAGFVGGVERLVNNNEDAQVDPWEVTNGAKGYNSVSRHIVYAGGVAKDGKTPKDTRTGCQKKALEKYVKDFHRRFPDVRIVGHNELAAKACPSFDVQKWLKEIGINQ